MFYSCVFVLCLRYVYACFYERKQITKMHCPLTSIYGYAPPPYSGLPVQLDWLLPVLLSDQYHRGTLRRHLWLRPVPHQVDSHRQGNAFMVQNMLTLAL